MASVSEIALSWQFPAPGPVDRHDADIIAPAERDPLYSLLSSATFNFPPIARFLASPLQPVQMRARSATFSRGYDVCIMAIDGTWRRNCQLNAISDTDAMLTVEGSIQASTSRSSSSCCRPRGSLIAGANGSRQRHGTGCPFPEGQACQEAAGRRGEHGRNDVLRGAAL